MKIKLMAIACLAALIFNSCISKKVETRIEYKKVENCTYDCHRVEVYLKNNSNKKLYFNNIRTIKNSKYYEWSNRANLRSISSAYRRRNLLPDVDTTNYCNCRHHINNKPQGFVDSLVKWELKLFKKHNMLEFLHDSILASSMASWLETKFGKELFFLEPNEECLAYWVHIDRWVEQVDGRYKYFVVVEPWIPKHKRYMKTTKENVGVPDEYYHGYFKEVAGYKLFKGKSRSNKLIIENGEVRHKK